jgi:hypothetical protein
MAIEIGPGWTIGGGISIVQPPPSATASWFGGGSSPSSVSTVDRITYATDTATASIRGPLSLTVTKPSAVTDATTYGWVGGGDPNITTVNRITYATDTATAEVRGPLTLGKYAAAGASGVQ